MFVMESRSDSGHISCCFTGVGKANAVKQKRKSPPPEPHSGAEAPPTHTHSFSVYLQQSTLTVSYTCSGLLLLLAVPEVHFATL